MSASGSGSTGKGRGSEDAGTATGRKKKSLLQLYDIPIEHLDFEYVKACNNVKELERIVKILRSGEEGRYPVLESTAEERLKVIAPKSVVLKKIVPSKKLADLDEKTWQETQEVLCSWQKKTKIVEEKVNKENSQQNKDIGPSEEVFPVRKSWRINLEQNPPKPQQLKEPRKKAIASCDYDAWEKYDADVDVLKMDMEEEKEKEQKKQKKMIEEEKRAAELAKKTENMKKAVESLELTPAEAERVSNDAKEDGNHYFRQQDWAKAHELYSRSIYLCPSVPAYNNRAITNLKLCHWREAKKDCDWVLAREETNVKALLRRSTAYQEMGDLECARSDLMRATELEPRNSETRNRLKSLQKDPSISRNSPFKMQIEDIPGEKIADLPKEALGMEGKSAAAEHPKIIEVVEETFIDAAASHPKIIEVVEDTFIDAAASHPKIIELVEETFIDAAEEAKTGEAQANSGDSAEGENRSIDAAQEENNINNNNGDGETECICTPPMAPALPCSPMSPSSPTERHPSSSSSSSSYLSSVSSSPILEVPSSPPPPLQESASRRTPLLMTTEQSTATPRISDTAPRKHKIEVGSKYRPGTKCTRERYSTDSGEDKKRAPPLETPFEFMREWQQARQPEQCAGILRRIPFHLLKAVLGSKVDDTMLSKIIHSTRSCLLNNEEDRKIAENLMKTLVQLPRFQLLVMFLAEKEKTEATIIFEVLKEGGFDEGEARLLMEAFGI